MSKKFKLVDENEYFYNCGHYPEWVVHPIEDPGYAGEENCFASEEEAKKEANRRNKISDRNWRLFLNG